jgi:hypothetical protein
MNVNPVGQAVEDVLRQSCRELKVKTFDVVLASAVVVASTLLGAAVAGTPGAVLGAVVSTGAYLISYESAFEEVEWIWGVADLGGSDFTLCDDRKTKFCRIRAMLGPSHAWACFLRTVCDICFNYGLQPLAG